MGTDPSQASGDYGYDMVHEDVGGAAASAPPAPPAPSGRPAPGGRSQDAGEDLAYDEAHDF